MQIRTNNLVVETKLEKNWQGLQQKKKKRISVFVSYLVIIWYTQSLLLKISYNILEISKITIDQVPSCYHAVQCTLHKWIRRWSFCVLFSKGLVQLHCKYIQCNFYTFCMFFILKYVIVNFIIQKLKSKHTSLKKYTNWAKVSD